MNRDEAKNNAVEALRVLYDLTPHTNKDVRDNIKRAYYAILEDW